MTDLTKTNPGTSITRNQETDDHLSNKEHTLSQFHSSTVAVDLSNMALALPNDFIVDTDEQLLTSEIGNDEVLVTGLNCKDETSMSTSTKYDRALVTSIIENVESIVTSTTENEVLIGTTTVIDQTLVCEQQLFQRLVLTFMEETKHCNSLLIRSLGITQDKIESLAAENNMLKRNLSQKTDEIR